MKTTSRNTIKRKEARFVFLKRASFYILIG